MIILFLSNKYSPFSFLVADFSGHTGSFVPFPPPPGAGRGGGGGGKRCRFPEKVLPLFSESAATFLVKWRAWSGWRLITRRSAAGADMDACRERGRQIALIFRPFRRKKRNTAACFEVLLLFLQSKYTTQQNYFNHGKLQRTGPRKHS